MMNRPTRIMIADDDPGIVDAIGMLLEYEGFEVSTASNGAAIQNIYQNIPDLLLLDIWMPGLDGREVCRKLKQTEATKKMPIIMISAGKDIGPSAIAAGADDFLAKPFEMDDLIKKIKKFIANHNTSGSGIA